MRSRYAKLNATCIVMQSQGKLERLNLDDGWWSSRCRLMTNVQSSAASQHQIVTCRALATGLVLPLARVPPRRAQAYQPAFEAHRATVPRTDTGLTQMSKVAIIHKVVSIISTQAAAMSHACCGMQVHVTRQANQEVICTAGSDSTEAVL